MRIPNWFHEDHKDREVELRAAEVGYDNALQELSELRKMLRSGVGEREIQNFLLHRPYLMLGRHRTGHGTYAFGEAQLGSQHKVDWAVANGNSGGLDWELVELESPKMKPFKRDGHFSEATRKGIEQIRDWRTWIQSNVDYAQRSKEGGGLGLYGINFNRGLVVIGRRENYDGSPGHDRYDTNRLILRQESHISLASYDSFIDSLEFRFSRERPTHPSSAR